MKLYELDWGLYPRRVGIYLVEKGITGIERIAFDVLAAWPAPEIARLSPMGTVPILETENGTLIRSSIAILEYLEERFPSPAMLGTTPEERARTREFVAVIDEAAIQFGIWCHKASPCSPGARSRVRTLPPSPPMRIMGDCGCWTPWRKKPKGRFWRDRRSRSQIA